MKRALGYVAVAAAIVGGVYYMSTMPSKVPAQAFDNMKFSKDFDQVTGDPKTGIVCHTAQVCDDSGCRPVASHFLLGKDFRKATPQERRAWIIADTKQDFEREGLACIDPSGHPFLDSAYAQKHNPGGGGCTSVSCNAHIVEGGGCELGGPNCVVTVICCGPCPPGCAS